MKSKFGEEKKWIPKNNLSNDNLWKEFEKKLKKKKGNNYFPETNNLLRKKEHQNLSKNHLIVLNHQMMK